MQKDFTNNQTHTHKRNQQLNFPFNCRQWAPNIDLSNYSSNILRVVSYNILADSLLSISTQIVEEDLDKVPHMNWCNRSKAIMNEINELNPDIICFQEFERDENFIRQLRLKGYDVK